jgi:hypothetical protein
MLKLVVSNKYACLSILLHGYVQDITLLCAMECASVAILFKFYSEFEVMYFFCIINTVLSKMVVGVLTTFHTQCTWYKSICIFYLIEQHSKFLLHTLQVLYMCTLCDSTNINMIIEFVPHKTPFHCRSLPS